MRTLPQRTFHRICQRFDWRCAYCSRPNFEHLNPRACLERDHVVPRSRGGLTTGGNTVPACRDCQETKGNSLLWMDYMPPNPHPELMRQMGLTATVPPTPPGTVRRYALVPHPEGEETPT